MTLPAANPRMPHREPYYGPLYGRGIQNVYAPEPWIRNLWRLGQASPNTIERMKMEHGRYLSGLGAAPGPDGLGDAQVWDPYYGSTGADARYASPELNMLEAKDDVYGSGIFSGGGNVGGGSVNDAPATANGQMGIFSSAYSLPGYLGREVPYTVSRDISDITDDGDVVMIPAGGMFHVEKDGYIVAPPVLGPTPRPPAMTTHRPPTSPLSNGYTKLTAGPPQTPLNPNAPVRPPPTYRPKRTWQGAMVPVPSAPPQTPMPLSTPQPRMPLTSIVDPLDPRVAIGEAPEPPSATTMFLWGGALGAGAGLLLVLLQSFREDA